ncbi:MAG: hypothetical protein A2Y97_09585 [Nitrospirae bacterium RBG_13_39_12]|nr:MAG: hypothetical protein A2Y97_09585 [Nitrospirae bacterium RBG_13_39_12]
MGFYAAGLNSSHRYEGLVDYIALNYKSTAEVGIGHFPDIAFALLAKGVKVFATDVLPFHYDGLKVVVDDITCPNISTYKEIDLIYSLRPSPEMVPYMVRLAGILSSDLIVKPLSSEYPGGQLTHSGKTTFFIWEYS